MEEQNRRKRARAEVNKGSGMRFNVGDYVMVSAVKNQANRQRHSKNMVRWQGPYVVTRAVEPPTVFGVRLVGTQAEKLVHWKKMRRIAGPGLFVSQAVQNSALHDLQRFLVESIDDWTYEDDGIGVKVLIRWQGYDESERTWEPLQQVYEDVAVITEKYVTAVNDPGLTAALEQVKRRVADETSSDDE